MEKAKKIEDLRSLLGPVIENHGAFLVDVSLKSDNKRQLLEIFCETETGITIEKCAEISREILPVIDSSKIAGDNFRLEVSSPGIGVPLKDKRQFTRNVGKLMAIKYREGVEIKQIEGDMIGFKDERVVIETGGSTFELAFDSIDEAVVKLRW